MEEVARGRRAGPGGAADLACIQDSVAIVVDPANGALTGQLAAAKAGAVEPRKPARDGHRRRRSGVDPHPSEDVLLAVWVQGGKAALAHGLAVHHRHCVAHEAPRPLQSRAQVEFSGKERSAGCAAFQERPIHIGLQKLQTKGRTKRTYAGHEQRLRARLAARQLD